MPTLNWSKLQLLNNESIDSVEEKPGVYRLSYKSADGPIYVFFVGKTDKSIKESLKNHLSGNIDNLCIKSYVDNLKCYFKYSIIEDEELRKNTHKSSYAHYSPKCNLDIPSGMIIDINFK